MKIERGVMVMKDGKAWGINQDAYHSISYGWVAPEDALIHSPRFCKEPSDATPGHSYGTNEIETGKLVFVERRTEVIIMTHTCEADAQNVHVSISYTTKKI